MRLVLDTNIALSGLLWRGVPGELIEAAVFLASARARAISGTAINVDGGRTRSI